MHQPLTFSKFITTFLFIIGIFFCSVLVFSFSSNSDYHLLLSGVKDSTGKVLGTFIEKAELFTDEVFQQDTYETNTEYEVGDVNLDLIDKIPDVTAGKVGYIKELLSIYRDAYEGKFFEKLEAPIKVTTYLGMHVNEVGIEPGAAADEPIPVYYFDSEEWKKNTPHYCFMDFTSKSLLAGHGNASRLDSSGGVGPFQFIGTGTTVSQSEVNPLSVGRATSGDVHFLPDAITYTTVQKWGVFYKNYLTSDGRISLQKLKYDFLIGLPNNRGAAGVCNFLCGLHDLSSDYHLLTNGSSSKLNATFVDNTISVWGDMFDDYYREHSADMDGLALACFDAPSCKKAVVIIAAHSQGFHINEKYCDWVLNKYTNFDTVCKALYPQEDPEDIKVKIKAMVSDTVRDSIVKTTGDTSVTDADCVKIYGSNTYTDGYRQRGIEGSIWYVSKQRDDCNMYANNYQNGNEPYIISSFDGVSAGYMFSSSGIAGRFLYARLLQIAGVDSVDPKDLSTFTCTVSSPVTENAPWSALASYLDPAYEPYKASMDLQSLTADRLIVLNKAADMAYNKDWIYNMSYAGGAKGWGRNMHNDVGWRTDCAHFCYLAYRFAGFEEVTYRNTSSLSQPNDDWEEISFNEMKIGDILCTDGSGHAVIYLGGDSKDDILTIEAIGEYNESAADGKRPRKEQVAIYEHRNMLKRAYICLRNVYVDKDLRGEPVDVPESENDPAGVPMY